MPLGVVAKNGEFMQRVRVFKAHKTIGRVMAKKYWLLSASQWLNSEGLHEATAQGLLDEINEYNPNPTEEMIQLRDFFINLLKSEPT